MPRLENTAWVPFGMKKPSEVVMSCRARRVSDTVWCQFVCEIREGDKRALGGVMRGIP